MTNPLALGSLAGKRALVTGSSGGIGADTAVYLAGAGASVVVNFRNKEKRALQLVEKIEAAGGTALAVGADLTDPASVAAMFDTVAESWGGLDILVLNASGGMESGMAEDYAMQLNRDAQVNLLTSAIPLLAPGSRVVFVTSHQAHFIKTVETMPEYLPVALSKRAGEDALRAQGLEDRRLTLVCNAVSQEQASTLPLKTAERALGRSFDVVVPEDRPLMCAAINQGVELAAVRRGSKVEKAIAELAALLAPTPTPAAAAERKAWWSRKP